MAGEGRMADRLNDDVERRRRITQESIDSGPLRLRLQVDVRDVLRAAAEILRKDRPYVELALTLAEETMSAHRFADLLDEVAARLERPGTEAGGLRQMTQEEAIADLMHMGFRPGG